MRAEVTKWGVDLAGRHSCLKIRLKRTEDADNGSGQDGAYTHQWFFISRKKPYICITEQGTKKKHSCQDYNTIFCATYHLVVITTTTRLESCSV